MFRVVLSSPPPALFHRAVLPPASPRFLSRPGPAGYSVMPSAFRRATRKRGTGLRRTGRAGPRTGCGIMIYRVECRCRCACLFGAYYRNLVWGGGVNCADAMCERNEEFPFGLFRMRAAAYRTSLMVQQHTLYRDAARVTPHHVRNDVTDV